MRALFVLAVRTEGWGSTSMALDVEDLRFLAIVVVVEAIMGKVKERGGMCGWPGRVEESRF